MAVVVLLPALTLILAAIGRLLLAMGDNGGGHVVGRVALAAAIVWAVSLVALVMALGFRALEIARDEPPSEM
ncbi:MAG TPA: hypothetical protein VHV77_14295 [Pirellulales bacterium]|jgi:hypothetical protein|nr:hypothetical protein [Pirellulales bacterium]